MTEKYVPEGSHERHQPLRPDYTGDHPIIPTATD